MEVHSVEKIYNVRDLWFCDCPECGEETSRSYTRFGPYSCTKCQISFMVMFKYYQVLPDDGKG